MGSEWNDTREARKKAIYNILNKCNKKKKEKKVVDFFLWGDLYKNGSPCARQCTGEQCFKNIFLHLKNVVNVIFLYIVYLGFLYTIKMKLTTSTFESFFFHTAHSPPPHTHILNFKGREILILKQSKMSILWMEKNQL